MRPMRMPDGYPTARLFAADDGPGAGGFRQTRAEPLETVHLFWLSGMSCDGCSVATTDASNPSLEELVAGSIPSVPEIVLHHPMLSAVGGQDFMRPFRQAVEGTLGAPYLVVLEGSVPDDQAMPEGQGFFSAMGAGGLDHGAGDQPIRMTDWLKRLAPGAEACIAIGTCATWGGIPAAAGNITGSMSLMDFLGQEYRSKSGTPVVNVPGCAPVGDNFTETIAAVLMFLQGLGPQPEFDELGRPAWMFGETVHHRCPKAGYYEEGVFAEEPGDNECLVKIGCWGPIVQCNITERGAIGHMGGCMVAGGACIGCTMPGFPDKYSPFYKAPPGSTLSGGVSKTYGAAIRRLRRMSMRKGNREPVWDRAGDIPTGWAVAHGKKPAKDKFIGFFYEKLQYKGSVNLANINKKQPQPRTMNVYSGTAEPLYRYMPPKAPAEEPARPEDAV